MTLEGCPVIELIVAVDLHVTIVEAHHEGVVEDTNFGFTVGIERIEWIDPCDEEVSDHVILFQREEHEVA